MTSLFPTRDYNRAISLPTEYYSKEEGFDTLLGAIKKVLIHIEDVAHIAIKPTKKEILDEMEEIEGFIEVPEKKENADRLSKELTEDSDMKIIISKFEELLQPGVLPEINEQQNRSNINKVVRGMIIALKTHLDEKWHKNNEKCLPPLEMDDHKKK